MNDDSLITMQEKLRQFNTERDWDQYHCPRNLAMALSVESAELLECFLWARDGETIPDEKRPHIAEEAADVLICLLNFCTQANIDLPAAFEAKLAKNAAKYPVDKARGSRAKYNDL
ncbi:MAG: nucleotide pyrophosphohydrolase [Proteobacteria bacterium]|nr:nucleotide pyrophosphohydrolase [Pseudomonadota bacterium]